MDTPKRKRGQRGPQKSPLKVRVAYKIKPDLIEKFRLKCLKKGVTQTSILEEAMRKFIGE